MGHDPRTEAFERLGGAYDVRVLEPSPPAVAEPPWFADDPAARGEVAEGRALVSPVTSGDRTWDSLCDDDPGLASWCADRWLGAWRRLAPLPPGFDGCREALHAVAERTVSPAREAANGKIGLRYTRGGFGTPFFGAGEQVRVEGADLVRVAGGMEASRDPIPTVEATSAAALADWYGFMTSVLEELRASAAPSLEPTRVQLWPEHFDLAADLGDEAAGARATYGGSPGDDDHHEPYLYVLPLGAAPTGELWEASGFPGAELDYADLVAARDQRAAALAFYQARLEALAS
ncbi:MAG TPA: hypothetical protein VHR88_01820 [Solirubrobacteraceae bacterium]|nr:hypothetical protein [Solirubrobacteraceae bacterium]